MTERTRTHRGTEYPVSEAHPAADAFPWLGEDELQELADDIRARRQEYKVVRLPDGRVIDGRNRELACRVAGIEPQYRTEDMTDDEVIEFVVSANVHRRNLSASQRAMAAAELANMKRGERKEQMGTGAHLTTEAQENKTSVAEAAQKLDVSERSVKSAKKVKDKAPELVNAVKDGDLDVKTAAKVADLPKKERKKVAKAADPKKAAKLALAKADDEKPALKIVPPAPLDAWGIPIQEHAAEAFAAVPKFKELVQAIQAAQKLFNEVTTGPGGAFLRLPSASSYRRGKKGAEGEYADRYVHTGLEQALQHVKAAAPKQTVCPYQYAEAEHPDDCRTCLNLKWTPELSSNVPPVCIDRAKAAFGVATKEAA